MFKRLQAAECLHWSVEASYVELYNESFRDLAEPAMAPAEISIFEQQCALFAPPGNCKTEGARAYVCAYVIRLFKQGEQPPGIDCSQLMSAGDLWVSAM